MSPIGRWFRQDPTIVDARRIYGRIVEQARRPEFFSDFGVPDNLDGRFEMVALHVFLVLHRLKQEGPSTGASELGQALCDVMIADMDASLREMGAGDLGVGGRVKKMASGFTGRISAYAAGLAAGPAVLGQALRRNVFGTVAVEDRQVEHIADYVGRTIDSLGRQSLDSLKSSALSFAAISPGVSDIAVH